MVNRIVAIEDEDRLVDLLLEDPDATAIVDRTIAIAMQFNNGSFEDDVTVVAVTVE